MPIVVDVLGPIISFLESLSFLGVNSHVIKLDYLDTTYIQPLADSLSIGVPLAKYTLSLFLAYPFAAILRILPGKSLKHLFSAAGGIFLAQWVFGPDWFHSIISSGITYLICALAPRKNVPLLVLLWAMGYMTGSHVYRMYVSYMSGIFDFTGTQMVLTMKLTSFAYNLYDGTEDKKNVFGVHDDKKKMKVYSERKKYAIEKLPNILEFFGYMFCFTCLLAGPAFEYNDYVRSVDGSAFRTIQDDKKDDDKKKKIETPEPSSVLPAMQRLLIGVLCLVCHLAISGKAPIPNVHDPIWIKAHGHLYRYSYLFFALMGERLKYYFAWKVAEGASILGGFGFEGYGNDGKVIGWKGVENVDIFAFELAPNIQTLSRVWNKRTQGWLERYTYLRTGRSLTATYFISAFWHGLYPGFFLFFMSIPLMTNIERLIKSKINPIMVPGYDGYNIKTYPSSFFASAYWVVSWMCTTLTMNYVVQVFSMGSWERCSRALGSFHHIPHIALAVIYVLLELAPSPKKILASSELKKK